MEEIKKDSEEAKPQEVFEAPSMLEEAKKVIEELKKQNAEKKILLEREEKLKAQEMLGGKSSGSQMPQKSEAETKKEMAKAFWKGSNIEKAIEKYG